MLACSLGALRFETSSLHLLPPDARYVKLYEQYSRNFGELDDIVIVVASDSPRRSVAFAERLVQRLRRGPVRFNRLAYRVDPDEFSGQRLLYLSLDELTDVRRGLLEHQDFIESFAARPGLNALVVGIRREINKRILMGLFDLGLEEDGPAGALTFLDDIVRQLHAAVDGRAEYRSPWAPLFARQREVDEAIFFSDDKRLLFVFADPVGGTGGFAADRDAVEEIRRRVAEVRAEFPGVNAGVTGGPALASDEMTAAFQDSKLATLLAVALTLAVLLAAFRQVVRPLLMLAVLGMSLVVSVGLITLTVGHLTIFSVMFISIVVGLGIDYGIYVLFRYEEHRREQGCRDALLVVAERSGPGIVLGGLGAVATFYVLMLTPFRGIQEFGFVAGSSLLVALLAMLTLFPALLVLVDSRPGARPRPRGGSGDTNLRMLVLAAERPRLVLVAAALASCVAAWAAWGVAFDYDVLNLQAKGTESVRWERTLITRGARSVFGALDTAGSIAELREKEAAFRRLPSVADIDSVSMLLPERQPEKLDLLAGMKPLLTRIRVGPYRPMRLEPLVADIATLGRRVAFAAAEAPPNGPGDDVRRISRGIEALQATLARIGRDEAARRLSAFDRELYDDFRQTLLALRAGLAAGPVTPESIPAELRRKFVGKDGLYLLEIYPRIDVWQPEGARRFVDELRSVAPDVTGTPVVTYESVRLMEASYRRGTLYAFLLVSALTAAILGRGRYTVLALVPLLIGTLWTVGLMRLFGLTFNLSNVWGLPLVIGASAEYGVNIVMRFAESRVHGGSSFARSTGSAVLLNGVTTIAGFGSLLVARHQGIWSLGLLLTLGSCAGLAAALLVLPALLPLFLDRRDGGP